MAEQATAVILPIKDGTAPAARPKSRQQRVYDLMGRRAVESYLAALEASTKEHPASNLMLGLFGQSGVGKTFLAEGVPREFGFDPVVVAAARHMDRHEDGAWDKFRKDALEARERGRRVKRRGLLIVNDMDRSNYAERDNEEGTSNRSGLIGNIQGLADSVAGGRAEPLGIIVTGNRTDVIPEPLQRSGRMRTVILQPDWLTRRRQLLALVGDDRAARLAAEVMMLRWPRTPIATLSSAVSIAKEEDLLDEFRAAGGDMEAFRARVAGRRDAPVKALRLLGAMRQLGRRRRGNYLSMALAVKTQVKTHLALASRLEWIALGFMSCAQGLGCKGETLQLLGRAIAFQVCSEVVIRAKDSRNIMIGEHRMQIDYQRFAIEADGCPEITFDPRRSPHEQVSRALGRWIKSLNKQWSEDGAVSREIAVVFTDDVASHPDRLQKARELLGVSPTQSDWGDFEPVTIGSLSPASLRETRHSTTVRGPRRR